MKNNVIILMKKVQLRSNMISMIIVMQLCFSDTHDTKNGIQFNGISASKCGNNIASNCKNNNVQVYINKFNYTFRSLNNETSTRQSFA